MSTCAICLQRQLLRLSRTSRNRALHTSARVAAQEAPVRFDRQGKPHAETPPPSTPVAPPAAPESTASSSEKKPVTSVPKRSVFLRAVWSPPKKPKAVKKASANQDAAVQASARTAARSTHRAEALEAINARFEIRREPDYDTRPEYNVPEDWAYAQTEAAASSTGNPDLDARNATRHELEYYHDRHTLKRPEEADSEDLRTYDVSRAMAEKQVWTPKRAHVRPDRRTEVSDLPMLPADDYGFDPEAMVAGMVRHDWKTRALSRVQRKAGRRWFPSLADKRTFPQMISLLEGDKFYAEYTEYADHFMRLLQLEEDEERRIFFERLKDWPVQMLKQDGQAMLGLSAKLAQNQPGGRWTDVEFRFMKNGEPAKLPYNRFERNSQIILSRRDPLVDPAERKDKPGKAKRIGGDISGYVRAVYRDCIVARFDREIHELDQGRWRVDIGLSTYVYAVQRAAIRHLQLNPVDQDAATDSNLATMYHDRGESDEDFVEGDEIDADPPRAEVILGGTALRHILFRAFQEKFKPYHSVAGILPVASRQGSQTTKEINVRASPSNILEASALDPIASVQPPANDTSILGGRSFLGSQSLAKPFLEDNPSLESANSTNPAAERTTNKTEAKTSSPPNDVVPPTHDLKPTDIDAEPVPDIIHADVSHMLYMNQHIHSWAMRHMAEGEPVRCEGDPDIPLNPSQIRAIAMMLYNRLSLVQGPPGTGKTRVIIETIKLLKQHWQIPHPILVTAHTNVAVDNLLAGLVAKDTKAGHGVKPIKALRVGPTTRVPKTLMAYTYEAVESQHPLYREIDHLGVEIEKLYFVTPEGRRALKDSTTRSLADDLEIKRRRLIAEMRQDVLADHDVICTTCIGAGSPVILQHIDFPFVFLDEASMATEPLSLVPLMKGSSQVAIIGDHKQLPPVIKSEEARFGGLDTSLFERLIHERNNVPRVMLDTQYRMHPAIAAFPSRTFYNGDLKDGTSDPDGTPWSGLTPPESTYLRDVDGDLRNVMFINHEHEQSVDHESLANFQDAEIVLQVVMDLLERNPTLRGSDIGIIAPYAAQIRLLHSQLRTDVKSMTRVSERLGTDRAGGVGEIEIKTVDGFEGREKEVIVFSTVRSNPGGWIGFLADWRRLNVGITRAKRALIIVGDAKTLENARIGPKAEDHLPSGGTDVWREFIQHLRAQGQIMDYSAIEGRTI